MSAQSTVQKARFVPPPSEQMFSSPDAARRAVRKGRGALTNVSGRYERERREGFDDGWDILEVPAGFATEVTYEKARSIITRNESPDISFDRSINPYRGCEHGCVYCFARPTHANMGLSPGLDFERRLFVKAGAAALLEAELAAPRYAAKTIAMGTNTDPYQPIERKERVTRQILEVLAASDHPVGIVTKSALVLRDLARRLEPRASSPERRLHAIEALSAAGVPASVMVAPIIPAINDAEIETILTRAAARGAREAGYVMLRLPLELQDLFQEWLAAHFPDRLRHVMTLVKSMRKGKTYDAAWGERMTGVGPFAWMVGRRFEAAAARNGYRKERLKLRTDLFRPPVPAGGQLRLL